jgi:hypothetical protein
VPLKKKKKSFLFNFQEWNILLLNKI